MSDQEQCRLKVLIEALQKNEIGLNDARRKMLARTPEPNDWAAFTYRIEAEELIWIAAGYAGQTKTPSGGEMQSGRVGF